MHIRDLNGRTICILGYGREGRAMADALKTHAPDCTVTIADSDPTTIVEDAHMQTQLGEDWLNNIKKFDVLIKSPGIPPHALPPLPINLLTNSTQIFLDTAKAEGALVIGVTGSKGKSTVASLIHHILQQGGKTAHLVGNIGDPAISHVAEAAPGAIFVMEISSYQLHDCTVSPQIAVITSFFPEHLDWHTSLESYHEAKTRITAFQDEDDMVFYADTPLTTGIVAGTQAMRRPVQPEAAPVDLRETALLGEHNRSNIALAAAVAREVGIDEKQIVSAIRSFTPLPHRLQSLGVQYGIEWIDDAISTTPQSTIAAIDALGGRVKVIILGGKDRGLPFGALGAAIDASGIGLVILLGESSTRIGQAISDKETLSVGSMEEAVQAAMQHLKHTDGTPVCLLSPASPSFDRYTDYQAKGDHFRHCVLECGEAG